MIGIILGSILGLFMSVAMISIKSFDERTNKTYNLNDKIEAYPPNEFRLGIYPMLIESLIIWLIFGAISGLLMLLAVIFVGFYNEREKTASQRYYDKNYAIKASLSNGFTLAMLLIGIWIPLYFMFNLILGNLHLNAKIISDSQLLLKQSILICFITPVAASNTFSAFFGYIRLRPTLLLFKYTPWDYERFLDYCVDRDILQRVGRGYRFIHQFVRDYIAQEWR
jgi:hypothetical protein